MGERRMKFRVLKPVVSEWVEAEGSVEDAIQDHHANAYGDDYRISIREDESHEGIRETMILRLYEVEDGEKLISTIYHTGIFRKGAPVNDAVREDHIRKICRELETTREKLFAPAPGEQKYKGIDGRDLYR